MNSNLNPLSNYRSRNVSSEAKPGFASRSISGNNTGNTWNAGAAQENQITPITTSPTRPAQIPRPQQQHQAVPYAQNGSLNTAPQVQGRPNNAVPQSHVSAPYPPQQTVPQLHTPPRQQASSSPPNNPSAISNRTPSPNSTPPSQPSPSPSPQRPVPVSLPNHVQQPSVNQVQGPYQQQQQYAPPPQHVVQPNTAQYPVTTPVTAKPAPQPVALQPQVHVQQPSINQVPAVMPVHEQATQEDAQSIPDDMLMALDEAQTMVQQQPQPRVNEHTVSAPTPEQNVTPVNHDPVPHLAVNPVEDELNQLRREVQQLRQDKSKEEELMRTQHQLLQHARTDLNTVRTQFNVTRSKESEMKREIDQLREQLEWKNQELREVRMTQLEQAPAVTAPTSDSRALDASDHDHVVYNVNTESDESEQHSVNDHSTHVLNLRMKVGTGNTQANTNGTTAGKHSPNNLQQLQIQGTSNKNKSPTANKSSKSSPIQSSSTKKAAVPSKGHKRSRDEMSRGHEESDEVGESKEAEKLKMALYKARVRLHNIKKVVLTDQLNEEKSSVNMDQLKAELLDCIQMQMTSQFDALKAEIANLATARATTEDDVSEPPTKKRKVSADQHVVPANEEAEKLVESLRGQIEQLTKQHQAARDEAEKSRQTSESLNHMLNELKHVREQDEQRVRKLSEDKTELLQRLADLEAQCTAATESARDTALLREQVQSLQEEVTKSRDELTTLRTRTEAAERQLEAAELRARELEGLFNEESGKSSKVQEENVKLQQECDKLKVVCKQLYLQIKSNKPPTITAGDFPRNSGSLNNSGNLGTSSEGQTTNDA